VAGQSRTVLWRAGDAATTGSAPASGERGSATEPCACAPPRDGHGETAVAFYCDEPLGLQAMLYVESRRQLDDHDRKLVDALLRQMVGAPCRDGASGIRPAGDT
jgi:hypothetical protein